MGGFQQLRYESEEYNKHVLTVLDDGLTCNLSNAEATDNSGSPDENTADAAVAKKKKKKDKEKKAATVPAAEEPEAPSVEEAESEAAVMDPAEVAFSLLMCMSPTAMQILSVKLKGNLPWS